MSEEVKPTRDELILKAKELYNKGSRNYLLKCYSEAADDLSEVCELYDEIYGQLSDELGMPYLLYAKSLISLALDENKVVDVPDQEEEDDAEDESEDDNVDDDDIQKQDDNVVEGEPEQLKEKTTDKSSQINEKKDSEVCSKDKPTAIEGKKTEEAVVTSTGDDKENDTATATQLAGDDRPSTSNGLSTTEENDEQDNEDGSSLQLAWEILELAAKIFTRQGLSGLPNLAEVQTELANIEFENNILEAARVDYEKALQIYSGLTGKYRRAMAEIHYKIGLTFLMQQMYPECADSLKNACDLIEDEINEMKAKESPTPKELELIKDLEETKQDICAKIIEIEETKQQNVDEVRAALDSFVGPAKVETKDEPSSCSSSSSKPTNISHLIKRKKPDSTQSSEAEVPAKKPAI